MPSMGAGGARAGPGSMASGQIAATRLANGQTVKFVKAAGQDKVLVMVNTDKLDAAWKQDKGFYIPPGGGGAEIGGRREGFKEFLKTGKPVEGSRVHLDRQGKASFNDGRHRFSVLRDKGAKSVGITVSRGQAERVKRVLG